MEKPILFSGEMVRAILDGRKTQTRRVVKLQPGSSVSARGNGIWQELHKTNHPALGAPGKMLACPYGMPGDLLWVRETWASHKYMDDTKPSEFTANAQMLPVWYRADAYSVLSDDCGKWRPSIFMPRWASRITLRVVDVRVEMLQQIEPEDCKAEGVYNAGSLASNTMYREAFAALWDSINADRGHAWYTNPWVRVVEFEVVKS